ncbi:HTTM domain-containing protein [Raineya orbicola]|uniref:Vitamin K-dependent gamma-carboxylase n=1 Tax=Raineya orbicola TaxID=2016530 RepID=A0A2N3IHG2_9BACT|nr:HTTM domain-containing protein [Raineya orbicola]PKQ69734.1 Vitamin K-dependent gamma-carboxylase [Raineya orbicola]
MKKFVHHLSAPIPAYPLGVFRLAFGLLMVFGTVRFMALGWIEDHYTEPMFHFKYWGFEWVEPLPRFWLYVVHFAMILAALGVAFATRIWYRISAIALFLTFTYTELIDLTYYLNHYYFVSLVCLLLCIIPSPPPVLKRGYFVPRWAIGIFKLQITIVYVYAGLAKINYDWLINALPLKIWLPANNKLPIIGEIFTWEITPYVFSWAGMIYDCTIPFFLMWRKTRIWAYLAVIVFHTLVGLLFQIGIFPLVMIGGTLIFFEFEKNPVISPAPVETRQCLVSTTVSQILTMIFLGIFFIFQMLFPWRYLLYEGNLFWTEEGYRFSWRVMLMEKAGTATFYVKDTCTGREGVVDNSEFLNAHQEKQMAMQPDMILQFAHFLGKYYEQKGVCKPQVRAEVYVTLNGQPSRLLIDPNIDLMKQKDTFAPKKWILR